MNIELVKNNIVRIKDIAEKAQVSKGTVDRVLHKRGRVSEEVREKVLQIIQEMDYQPNLIARTLKNNKSYHIVALIPDPSLDPYWEAPKSGLEKAGKELRQYGIMVKTLIFNPHNIDSFLKQAKEVSHFSPDGILLAPVFYREVLPFFEQWQSKKIPFVLFNTQIPDSKALSYIGQDSFQSGFLAAKILHFGLHENCTILVAHVNEDLSNSAHLIEKEEGFRSYFKQYGIQNHYQVHRLELGNPDSSLFTHQLAKSIKDYPNLKGIFVSNSKAFEIAFYLEKHRLSHIKLIGYDLVPKNIHYLENGVIQFLINQNPKAQGYWGIYQLSDHLVFSKEVLPIKYLPLDLITKENLNYYIDAAQ